MAFRPRRSFLLSGVALGGAAALAYLPQVAFGSSRARTGLLGKYRVIHDFSGDSYDVGALVKAPDGSFYGVRESGGPTGKGFGGIYRLSPDGTLTVLRMLEDEWGDTSVNSSLNLCLANDGNLYGMGFGQAWRIAPDGSQTELHYFDSGTEGFSASAGLIQGRDGHLYGTMSVYATVGGGTIFRMTLAGEVSILYRFGNYGSGDGDGPEAELLHASDGYLYGSTVDGGRDPLTYGSGTLFRIRPDGSNYAQLLTFQRRDNDVTEPRNPLSEGDDGRLYCATGAGGLYGDGAVFAVSPLVLGR